MRQKKKMKEKNENQVSQIEGEFIYGLKTDSQKNYQKCWVKLDLIKTIHELEIINLENQEGYCVFFTYKDEYYIAKMSPYGLVKAINHRREEGKLRW